MERFTYLEGVFYMCFWETATPKNLFPKFFFIYGWNCDFVTVEPVGSGVLRPVGWLFTSLFLCAFGSIALEKRDGIKKIEIKKKR